MARSALLFALFLLPAIAVAHRHVKSPLVLEGKVLCDSCVAGFETRASTPIADAKVRVVCKDRADASIVKYTQEAKTNKDGCYKMAVKEDHGDDVCDVSVLSSPQLDCAKPVAGREVARVILTRYNGMSSDTRYANTLIFAKARPDYGCQKIMQEYQTEAEDLY